LQELDKELVECDVAVLLVSRSNLNAPWMLFEAGAIGREMDRAQVIPIGIDLEPSDMGNPLNVFQGTRLTKEGLVHVIAAIHSRAGGALSEDECRELVDPIWDQLNESVTEAIEQARPNDSEESEEEAFRRNVVNLLNYIKNKMPSENFIVGAVDMSKRLDEFGANIRNLANDLLKDPASDKTRTRVKNLANRTKRLFDDLAQVQGVRIDQENLDEFRALVHEQVRRLEEANEDGE